MSGTVAAGLKDFHKLHLQLEKIQNQLDRGPKRIRAKSQFVLAKEREQEEQHEQVKLLRKTVDQKNLQLRTNEAKIEELKTKLNAATSNREFDIIKSHIEADQMANSVLEDEILEVLEKVDQAQQFLAQLEQECVEAREEVERVTAEVKAAEPALHEEAEKLNVSIREFESTLPGEIHEKYQRLVRAHSSSALAPMENGACGSCCVALSPNTRIEVNSGHLLFCRNCGRLLYKPDEG